MSFDPALCGLCGSGEQRIVVNRPAPSMTSDGRRSSRRLFKIACRRCGLVRNGDAYDADELRKHYEVEYELAKRGANAEPVVFTRDGPVARSALLAEWLSSAVDQPPESVLEIGCGEGSVLAALGKRWPSARMFGVDMSRAAVETARARGLHVEAVSYEDVSGAYELVYSIAVIEHVASPVDFLRRLSARLSPGGSLVSIQPHQDAPSIDVFFTDHLHHFTTAHLAAVGARAGLRQIGVEAQNPLLPGFSRHDFTPGSGDPGIPSRSGAVESAISLWDGVFARVDAWLREVEGRRMAIWGTGQTADALDVYSRLGKHRVDAVVDDNAGRFSDGWRDLDVVGLETSAVEGPGWAVLLTFHPGAEVIRRLEARGLDCYYSVV